MVKNIENKKILRYLLILLISSIAIVNMVIISIPKEPYKHAIIIIILNVTAAITTSLGVVSIYRFGIKSNHERSYLFLTMGISVMFVADLFIMYSYFALGIDEVEEISISDVLWLTGYLFLIFHLILVIKTIKITSFSKTIGVLLILIILFIIANLIGTIPNNLLTRNHSHNRTDDLENFDQ